VQCLPALASVFRCTLENENARNQRIIGWGGPSPKRLGSRSTARQMCRSPEPRMRVSALPGNDRIRQTRWFGREAAPATGQKYWRTSSMQRRYAEEAEIGSSKE
jgi:hypothetical protein